MHAGGGQSSEEAEATLEETAGQIEAPAAYPGGGEPPGNPPPDADDPAAVDEPAAAPAGTTRPEGAADAAPAEAAGQSAEARGAAHAKQRRLVSTVALILVVLTSLGVTFSVVGLWAHDAVFDTESFVEIVEPVLTSEEVATVLTDFVTEQATAALDLERRLEERLGAVDSFLGEGLADILNLGPRARELLRNADLPRIADLAAPIEAAVEERIRSVASTLVRSEEFQGVMTASVSLAHQGAVTLIREGDSAESFAIVDGEVRLDLLPAIVAVLDRVLGDEFDGFGLDEIELPSFVSGERVDAALARLSDALGTLLPDDFGQVTIMTEDRLGEWQAAVRVVDRIVVGLLVVTVLLGVGAVVVSARRRRTLIQLALGTVVGLLLVTPLIDRILDEVEAAVKGPDPRAAARAVFEELFSGLRRISVWLTVLAVALAFALYLAGRPRWLMQLVEGVRERLRGGAATGGVGGFVTGHRDTLLVGGFVMAVIAWLVVGFSLVSVLLIGGLLALYLWAVSYISGQGPVES
jgi:hypothetical protein